MMSARPQVRRRSRGGSATTERAIPGPRSAPLLGWRANVLPLLQDPALSLLRLQRRYGDVVALGQEPGAPVGVFAPAYNHQVLTDTALFYSLDVNDESSFVRMPQNTAASRVLSGVAGMNGATHKQHRRLLMPGFHRARVALLRDTVVARTEEHIARWRLGQQIDVAREMVALGLSLATSALLGLKPGDEGHGVSHLLEVWSKHGLSPQVVLLPFDVVGLPYHRFLKLSEQLEAVLRAVIARKRAMGVDGGDVLSMLLQAQDEDAATLSDAAVLGHLTTFFTAGHETTASALTWTLFLLTQHPRVLADLLDELDGVLHGAAPTVEQLNELPLLTGVINEGLRLFPPGMWLLRTTTAPCTLGPYDVPAGTHVVISPVVTHYRPDLYDQPHAFLPRRWETIRPSPYEYLPFGAGPRRCLGATFALLEMQLVLSVILQRYQLRVPDNTRVDRSGTILSAPKGGLPMVVCPRDGHYPQPRVRGNIHQLVQLSD